MNQPPNPNLMIILAAGTTIILGVLFCIWLWWCVLKVARILVKHGDAFGSTVAIRVVALGMTAWLRPEVLTAPINAVSAFVEPFLTKVPQLVASLAQYHRSGEINWLSDFFPQLTSIFVSALINALSALQLPNLIFTLALWIALGSVLSVLLHQEASSSLTRLLERVGSLSHTTRINTSLIIILSFGCYLSITAIIAVPYLRQSAEPTETEKTNLATRLDESRMLPEVYNNRYPIVTPTPEGFSKLRQRVKDLSAPFTSSQSDSTNSQPGTPAPEWNHEELSLVSATLEQLDISRSNLVTSYKSMRDMGLQQQMSMRNTAMNIFAVNGGRGEQERARYSTELNIWYRTQLNTMDTGLLSCAQDIATFDGALNMYSSVFESILSSTGGSSGGVALAVKELSKLSNLHVNCSFYISEDPPERMPASRWGVIGTAARWLLRAESLDLALIAGMLGFGLFGAAISTFVRKGALVGLPTEPMVADLAGVIIRGLSAAVVVFLAALGGLAIFSNSEGGHSTEPNPYALFLTCLAAAVFSEDVWIRVRSRLREQAGSTEVAGPAAPPIETEAKGPDASGEQHEPPPMSNDQR